MDSISKHAPWREQYGLATCIYRPQPLEHALRRIAASGFRWVEISQFHMDPRRNPDVKAAAALLRELGLGVHSLHTPFIGVYMGHPGQARQAQALQIIGDALALGAQLGAPLAIVHVATDIGELPAGSHAESRQAALEVVGELAGKARALGIRIALENLTERPQYGQRFGDSLVELAQAFPAEEYGFCLDTGHAALGRLDLRSEIAAAGQRLVSTHVQSGDGQADRHWLPNRGLVNWEETRRLLVEGGYGGRYIFEILTLTGPGPDEVLRQAVEIAQAG